MFIIVVLISSYSLVSVWSLGVYLQCPDTFYNGENNVTCTINRTAIKEANCKITSKAVTIDWTIHSQTTTLCQYNYDLNQQCNTTLKYSPGSCWCNKSDGDIFMYTLSFLANSSLDQGGQFECKICISPEKPLSVHVDESCRNISFASEDLNTNGYNQAVVGGISGAVAVALAVITIIIAVMIYFKKHDKFCWSSNRCRCFNKEESREDGEESNEML